MRTFRLSFAMGVLLLALFCIDWGFADLAARWRHDSLAPSHGVRTLIRTEIGISGWCLCILSLLSLWNFRSPETRTAGWKGFRYRKVLGGMRVLLALSGLLLLLPVLLCRELYLPLDAGGRLLSEQARRAISSGPLAWVLYLWPAGVMLSWDCYFSLRFGRQYKRNLALEKRGVPLCPQCAYVLVGLDSGRCPECGTPIDSPSGSK